MSLRNYVIAGMAYIIPLQELRSTPNVQFHALPGLLEEGIDAIDRVEHQPGAFSPSVKDRPDYRPWYMHPDQEDNLMVFHGKRIVELYTTDHGKMETFEVTPYTVSHNGVVIHEGPCLFGWPVNVFHRVYSPEGSMSMNFARHFAEFSLLTNFNIYDLNVETGEYSVVREGHLDQPSVDIGE